MAAKKKKKICCFIDTNLLLHFQTFDEIDWKKILQASQVDLVIAPVVLREINKFKDDRADDWRRKRARMLIPKLRDFLMSSKQLRKDVVILGIAKEPTLDWALFGLDPQISDDRLIATIIEFRNNHLQEDIILVSDDILLQFKAQFHEITTLEPDGLINRYERPSEEMIKIQKLEFQIQQLTSRSPKLRCGFYNPTKNEISDTILLPVGASWKWESPAELIAQELIKKREGFFRLASEARGHTEDQDIEDYIDSYERYLQDYENTLKKMWLRNSMPCIKVNLAIENYGTAPAKGGQIDLTFPVGSSIVERSYNEINWEIIVPKEPIPRWRDIANRNASEISHLSSHMVKRKISYLLEDIWAYFPPGNNEYAQTFEKISHNFFTFVKPLTVFLPPETKQGFTITYSLSSDELIDFVEGSLKVDWYDIQ